MSLSKKFGSKKNEEEALTVRDAMQRLEQTKDMLTKECDILKTKIHDLVQVAKENGIKNKQTATNALKRKKMLEKQLQQRHGELLTLEFQRGVLENANMNTEVLNTMGYAAKALKNAQQQDVDGMLDDLLKQIYITNEISEAISTVSGEENYFDEHQINAEQEKIQQEDLDENLLHIGETPNSESLLERFIRWIW